MNESLIIQRLFEYIKGYLIAVDESLSASKAVVSVCDLKEGDQLVNPLVCILPIRDAVAGMYVKQTRISPEIQIVCYCPEYYQLGAVGQLDDIVRYAMVNYPNPPSNYHLVRRFFSTWVDRLSAFRSIQIYQFHIVNQYL